MYYAIQIISLLGILFGAVLTGIIQSASASVGILQSLSSVEQWGTETPFYSPPFISACCPTGRDL